VCAVRPRLLYSMPHSVCAEEIAEIGAWLTRVLAPATSSQDLVAPAYYYGRRRRG